MNKTKMVYLSNHTEIDRYNQEYTEMNYNKMVYLSVIY